MKQAKRLNLNIVLAITCVLLLFVCLTINYTGAWLVDDDTINFTVQVDAINIQLKQGSRELTSMDNNIYLGIDVLQGDTDYEVGVTLTNKEDDVGYFVRYKVVAQVDGGIYNINNCVDTELYKGNDGWIYVSSSSTPVQMTSGQTVTLIKSINLPSSAGEGKFSIQLLKGKFFRLYLYVQGSPLASFTA